MGISECVDKKSYQNFMKQFSIYSFSLILRTTEGFGLERTLEII